MPFPRSRSLSLDSSVAPCRIRRADAPDAHLSSSRPPTIRAQFTTTQYLREQLADASERLDLATKEATRREEAHAAERAAAAEKTEADARAAEADAKTAADALRATIEEMKRELDEVKEFRGGKQAMIDEIAGAKADLARAREEAARAANETRLANALEKSELAKEYEHKFDELKRQTSEDLETRLDDNSKRILAQNRKLADELRLHMRASAELEREKKVLFNENRKLRREVELRREMEEVYAKRFVSQKKEHDVAKDRVKALEHAVKRVTSDFDDERERIATEAWGDRSAAAEDANELRRLLHFKSKELSVIKKLAKEAVKQRGDMERFMIDSLEIVKKEIASERTRGGGGGGGGGGACDVDVHVDVVHRGVIRRERGHQGHVVGRSRTGVANVIREDDRRAEAVPRRRRRRREETAARRRGGSAGRLAVGPVAAVDRVSDFVSIRFVRVIVSRVRMYTNSPNSPGLM